MAGHTVRQPEVHWTKPTPHVPNSARPFLVYRNVLPEDLTLESATEALEANNWMKGGVFSHYPTAHFHSNTPECYAAIRGSTTCLYGVGPLDNQENGIAFHMKAGDIAVHAPGVAHRNVKTSTDYEYVGAYPKFVQLRQAVVDAFNAREKPLALATTEAEVAEARRNAPTIDYLEVARDAHIAAAVQEKLLPFQQTCANRLGQLRTFITNLGGPSRHGFENGMYEQVRSYAIGEHVRRQAELQQMQATRDRFRRDADYPPVPGKADGRHKMLEAWMIPSRKGLRKTARRAAFRGSASGYGMAGERWEGAWMIPGGGMSMTGLWVQIDEQGYVEDRIVRKDTFLDQDQWGSAAWIDGDLRDPGNRWPFEIACHSAVHRIKARASGNIGVPRLIARHVDDTDTMYKMYLEWCPFGDMSDLISAYRQAPKVNNLQPHIPEPVLWYLFRCLAEVGLAMEQGHTSLDDGPRGDWWQIVHRDIKPNNVFFAAKTAGHFDDYLTPKLGDFGSAFKTKEDDPFNPQLFRDGPFTKGWSAPETRSYVDRETLEPIDRFKILAATNVYGVGLVMFGLMALELKPVQPMWLGDDETAHNVRADAKGKYSDELIELVQQCLTFQPTSRPRFKDILRQIEVYTDESGLDLAQRMRLPATADPQARRNSNWLAHYTPADRYKIGFALNQLPADRGS
ncbi:hypothetical protein LTR36_006206 [Oleoguttula mirabilis]|uniref:Protein kinase domain-containing protein n=1 Tax=Oleoguttula mirabilis TaxID=1507867 RepID=A0AAV9JCL7_9PEZI|nr:hypothetical protein LTR36_006206 [Oleoguttula mirabilis]